MDIDIGQYFFNNRHVGIKVSAVSYTHLDVYKRQLCQCVHAPGGGDDFSRLVVGVITNNTTYHIRMPRHQYRLLIIRPQDLPGHFTSGQVDGDRVYGASLSEIADRFHFCPIFSHYIICLLYTSRCV